MGDNNYTKLEENENDINLEENNTNEKLEDNNKNQSNMITEHERNNFVNNRGRTMCLGEEIAAVLGIPPKNLEIGASTITKYGIITHCVHYVYTSDLEIMETDLAESGIDNNRSPLTAQTFTSTLYSSLKKEIDDVFRKHFDLNSDFEVLYTHRHGMKQRTLTLNKNKNENEGNKSQRTSILKRLITENKLSQSNEYDYKPLQRKLLHLFENEGYFVEKAKMEQFVHSIKVENERKEQNIFIPLPSGWRSAKDSNGRVFYVN